MKKILKFKILNLKIKKLENHSLEIVCLSSELLYSGIPKKHETWLFIHKLDAS